MTKKMQRDIDIGLLRAFIAVAETKSMTRAANIVSLTQSAVSQRIKRLEDVLSLKLFERTVDAMRLTSGGERLLSRAYKSVANNDQLVTDMWGTDFSGEVKLGVPPDVVASMMPPTLRLIRRAYPHVLVTLVSDNSQALHAKMCDKKIDLVLMTDAVRGNQEQFLLTDRLVWVGAKGGEAHKERPLSVSLGEESCAFRSSAVEALNKAEINWRAICQEGSLEPVFATLKADIAVAPFLSRAVPDDLTILKNTELPPLPEFHINLRTRPDSTSAITLELARLIQDDFTNRYGF
ncbi:MAG: LysR family transcriptional regulator [Rhodospirillaceae bacterium]|nr:MAG: LysR family transcriptional regulator [Rhodospirillaceae bacterium]